MKRKNKKFRNILQIMHSAELLATEAIINVMNESKVGMVSFMNDRYDTVFTSVMSHVGIESVAAVFVINGGIFIALKNNWDYITSKYPEIIGNTTLSAAEVKKLTKANPESDYLESYLYSLQDDVLFVSDTVYQLAEVIECVL